MYCQYVVVVVELIQTGWLQNLKHQRVARPMDLDPSIYPPKCLPSLQGRRLLFYVLEL